MIFKFLSLEISILGQKAHLISIETMAHIFATFLQPWLSSQSSVKNQSFLADDNQGWRKLQKCGPKLQLKSNEHIW